jgi:CelD/BcsL family acetyltransferase involved in cellulose biosynthesis
MKGMKEETMEEDLKKRDFEFIRLSNLSKEAESTWRRLCETATRFQNKDPQTH